MKSKEDLTEFLTALGCRKRGDRYILDGLNGEFYLIFNASDDPETPESLNTCDIIIAPVGSYPLESVGKMRIATNCGINRILKFLIAIGLDQVYGEIISDYMRWTED